MLGLRAISFWVGTCDTRSHGPPAQWLSLPFNTPEGAWPLSQSTWVQRWSRDHGFSKGGFLTSPRFPRGGSVSAVTSPRTLRATIVVAYVVPTAFGTALLRILGSPLLRLPVLQRAAAAAAIDPSSDTGAGSDQGRLTRTTQQANHAPSPSEWGMRVGAAYTQTQGTLL